MPQRRPLPKFDHQGVIGAIRTAVLRQPQLLKSVEFEDALARLIFGFLAKPGV